MAKQVTSELFTLYAINVNGTYIYQVQDCNWDYGNNEAVVGGDGTVYNTFTALLSQKPVITFKTTMVATALGICGATGLQLPVTDLWFQSIPEGGTRGGAGTNIKLTVNEGIMVPISLTVRHGGIAEITYGIHPTWNGTNNPIVIAINQNLSGTAVVSELFTAGPLNVNGSNVESIQDINVDFGIAPIIAGGDGTVWDTFAAIMNINPSALFTTTHLEIINTLTLTGAAQTDTDSVFYLTKISEGGARVANGTAQHISGTVDEGRIGPNGVSAAHGAFGTAIVKITPTFDGTNAPFAFATNAMIS